MRMVVSLAVVLGLLLLLARLGSRRFQGRAGSPVKVLHRQSLTRGSSVAVVTIGSRVLVLGTTDQQVRMLAELDPADLGVGDPADLIAAAPADGGSTTGRRALVALPTPEPAAPDSFAAALAAELEPAPAVPAPQPAGRHRAAAPAATPRADQATDSGPFAGSLLSAQTWRQAARAVTGRAS